MPRTRTVFLLLLVTTVLPMGPAGGAQTQSKLAPGRLAIIVNRANPIEELTLDELRSIFLAKRRYWPHGRKITLLMLERKQPDRIIALRLIYRMTDDEFTRYFIEAVFKGEVESPPRVLRSPRGVQRFVFHSPGAIGYVRADEVDGDVKVLRINGRAPADAGYRLTLTEP